MTVAREAFLAGMRGVAHSVAIVTTDGPAGRHGATVTSFCSVSADPPSLLVCLRTGSRIAAAVKANERFCINVLRASAVALAERFAGRSAADDGDRFTGVELRGGHGPPPVLGDAAVAFHCTLAEALTSGSHVIVVGHVMEVQSAETQPLAYLDGRYASVQRHPHPAIS